VVDVHIDECRELVPEDAMADKISVYAAITEDDDIADAIVLLLTSKDGVSMGWICMSASAVTGLIDRVRKSCYDD
jgi:hypothetical protein